MPFIDTHSHILPDMDDGALNLAQAVDFAITAEKQGVNTIFATPHCCDGIYNCKKESILKACFDLSEALREKSINVKILPGAEIKLCHDFIARFDSGQLLTLADKGTFVLLELPPMFINKAVFLILKNLKERGVIPVIAHAERNPMILTNLNLFSDLIRHDALIQVNAGSLCGDFGSDALKAAKAFIKADHVFCIGSDIHPGRKYRMADAEKIINRLIGRHKAAKLFQENPELILTEHEFRKIGN